MLLDRIGYILFEIFMLLVVIACTKAILRLRRGQGRFFSPDDREVLFQPIKLTARAPMRFFRYAVIFTLVVTLGAIEILIFAPFGAAIVAGALLVTCTTIVHRGLAEY